MISRVLSDFGHLAGSSPAASEHPEMIGRAPLSSAPNHIRGQWPSEEGEAIDGKRAAVERGWWCVKIIRPIHSGAADMSKESFSGCRSRSDELAIVTL